ncbi:5'-nucleotidase, lipoprotein e(P4) family [Gracilimonas sp.]|uniref:5'-nucleotidase, lipoprotein e(P4) family n=1 Tax=Gracilimonas sp. TaxID=1974203 RepID=UPI002870CAF7|nr:5'-nucleotidase, lipoprotein e(P4) family [Gracilimonas sp.]
MYSNKSIYVILFLGLISSACSTSQNVTTSGTIPLNKTTQATLWVQNAAEYKAHALQAYNTAERMLPLAIEDSYWTASINQEENQNFSSLPPAVILDIDETVLDNSPFQARMIKQGKTFNVEDWNAWCNQAEADAITGAVAFTNYAKEHGVTIFYISNRSHEVEYATRKNLIEQGFPVSDDMDNIMTNGEEPEWNSSKIQRRNVIEENYRVIMSFGDDFNDFLPAKEMTQQERYNLLLENADKFGERWFVFPNPVYGSWEDALFDFNDDLTEEERNRILNNRLNTKN